MSEWQWETFQSKIWTQNRDTQTHTTREGQPDREGERDGSPGLFVMQIDRESMWQMYCKGGKIQSFFIYTSIDPQPLVLSPLSATSEDQINGCHVSAAWIVRTRLVAYELYGCELDGNPEKQVLGISLLQRQRLGSTISEDESASHAAEFISVRKWLTQNT